MASPNQRALARAVGLSQTTVSLALRRHPSIPAETRDYIFRVAREIGYQPNAYVACLMSRIRSGNPPPDRGCIALLADAENEDEWLYDEIFRKIYEGMRERALESGFYTEPFYLRSSALTGSKINRILTARGIRGLVLAPQRRPGSERLSLQWDNYACSTVGYTWEDPLVDRIVTFHRHNIDAAYEKLVALGHKRIATCLPHDAVDAVNSNWLAGFYLWYHKCPPRSRIPLFVVTPGSKPLHRFSSWIKKWKPDALVTLKGDEIPWLENLGYHIPDDISVVCFNRRLSSTMAGMQENFGVIGGSAIDVVTSGILGNRYGLPAHPKILMIEGYWADGPTVRSRV